MFPAGSQNNRQKVAKFGAKMVKVCSLEDVKIRYLLELVQSTVSANSGDAATT